MSALKQLLSEFESETANTRRALEAVPDDKFNWKSHPKSNTIGWNVSHLVEIVEWIPGIIESDSWDIAPAGGEPYETHIFTSRDEALQKFDQAVAQGRNALQSTDESKLEAQWSLLAGGNPYFTLPKHEVIRTYVMNHTIHHRAMLCSYLRLNDLPVPGMYGPSGD
ncbi:DinB family protein [Planctomicrobium sp. SH668]|uniref:DinB family protein n=1 Tax=Planctomicrobium sp. SH668 TaxID=3448126 RepID=UPI003F5BF32F